MKNDIVRKATTDFLFENNIDRTPQKELFFACGFKHGIEYVKESVVRYLNHIEYQKQRIQTERESIKLGAESVNSSYFLNSSIELQRLLVQEDALLYILKHIEKGLENEKS